jgi:hypothetical protein
MVFLNPLLASSIVVIILDTTFVSSQRQRRACQNTCNIMTSYNMKASISPVVEDKIHIPSEDLASAFQEENPFEQGRFSEGANAQDGSLLFVGVYL